VNDLPARLARRSRFRPGLFVPFSVRRARLGWVRPELAARLAAWPKVFKSSADELRLLDIEALAPVLEQLAQEGFIPGWRNELYRIAELFDIERAAARPFGLTTHAVHINGISFDQKSMWLARRAASKPIDAGMLDNLVGGGVSAGSSLEETLVKEAWEEAGIPAELARSATRGGTVRILREVPEGVQSELVHVYDLALPRDFAPQNRDGEVDELRLASFDEVERLIRETDELTFEAALVALDYFSRRSVRPGSASAGAGRPT
jgi:8-oxo-dGTP pyrophosphatase MutT (NUDIX family)